MPTLLFCQIRFVDYLNGMWYMICLPSLLCGMAVSVEDIRARRIPRMWIAVGCLAQVIVDITYALSVNSLFLALQALLFAALSAVLQCALALIKPRGFGIRRRHHDVAYRLGRRHVRPVSSGVLVVCD